MTDLLHTPGDNVGGLHLIRFVPVVGVVPAPATGRPSTLPLTFVTGYRWLNAYCTPFSARYDEDTDPGDPGTAYAITVEGFWPGAATQAGRKQLEEMTRHRFIIETSDMDGCTRRAGTTTEPLQFTYKFRSGTQPGDRRGYILTWSGLMTAPPPIIV